MPSRRVDTSDMEKSKVDLRIVLERHRRRFNDAQQQHTFEEVVRACLEKNKQDMNREQQENFVPLQGCDLDGSRQLRKYLRYVIDHCRGKEQIELFNSTVRAILQDSVRQSILVDYRESLATSEADAYAGQPALRPFCLCCGKDLNEEPQPRVQHVISCVTCAMNGIDQQHQAVTDEHNYSNAGHHHQMPQSPSYQSAANSQANSEHPANGTTATNGHAMPAIEGASDMAVVPPSSSSEGSSNSPARPASCMSPELDTQTEMQLFKPHIQLIPGSMTPPQSASNTPDIAGQNSVLYSPHTPIVVTPNGSRSNQSLSGRNGQSMGGSQRISGQTAGIGPQRASVRNRYHQRKSRLLQQQQQQTSQQQSNQPLIVSKREMFTQ